MNKIVIKAMYFLTHFKQKINVKTGGIQDVLQIIQVGGFYNHPKGTADG
jgi:hypothetical protein